MLQMKCYYEFVNICIIANEKNPIFIECLFKNIILIFGFKVCIQYDGD